jgi:hypothetical protein
MVRFLNQFSKMSEANNKDQNRYLEDLFVSFLNSSESLSDNAFINVRNNRFNIALFEAAFTALLEKAFAERRVAIGEIDPDQLAALADDGEFQEAAGYGTTRTANVNLRLKKAREYLGNL